MAASIVVVLLGPPGAGKGTQAKKMVEKFDLTHVSTGDLLREEVRSGSSLGQRLKAIMEAGLLVPDQLVSTIVAERVRNHPNEGGLLLDGYPRNLDQASFLGRVTGGILVWAIHIRVLETEVIRRLAGRRDCRCCGRIYNVYLSPSIQKGICDDCGAKLIQRPDDREEVIQERLQVYRQQTKPVIQFYAGREHYSEVDGNRTPEQVASQLAAIVEEMVGKLNWQVSG